jgi:hypothetical protein
MNLILGIILIWIGHPIIGLLVILLTNDNNGR